MTLTQQALTLKSHGPPPPQGSFPRYTVSTKEKVVIKQESAVAAPRQVGQAQEYKD